MSNINITIEYPSDTVSLVARLQALREVVSRHQDLFADESFLGRLQAAEAEAESI